jgi:hypothetical protein
MPVFRFQLKILRLAHAPRKLERLHNPLLHIQFPFMLINNAPLCHDHDRIQSGRAQYDALPHGRGRSNLNG